jgi:hypothetical protein
MASQRRECNIVFPQAIAQNEAIKIKWNIDACKFFIYD